ncbi:MAG: carboxypeptidase-like regulatory domain-containing protein, partial [Candidatus Hydrogenedentes bacterium]|nr:carboxypeptidase-like regulatory domain-containing protein [Candidatus Hydrogenedentota bacterium]
MRQRRQSLGVAVVVIAVVAVIIFLRAWWQVESPVPRAVEPVESETAPSAVEPAPAVDEPSRSAHQPPPAENASAPEEETPPLAISGCVRNTLGKPIRGAVVACGGDDGQETRTDREGRYRIEGLPDHIFAMAATHPGYFREQKPFVAAGTDYVDFALTPRASLEIQAVRSDTQDPLPYYRVNFHHTAEAPRSVANGNGFGAKVQDPAGRVTISDLEPVAGILRVWQEGYTEQKIAVSAEELVNTPHSITVVLEPSREGLEGIVVNTRGEPIAGAYILKEKMSWADDVPGKAETQTGRDGRFRIDAPRGPRQDIIACHPDYAPGYVTIYHDTSPRQLLRIVLEGMATVRGRVTLDGEPLEKCHVVAFFKGERALDENGKHTDAEGRYELRGLPPGLAHVEARVDPKDWGGDGAYIAQTAELVEGETTFLDFDLQRPTGVLEGRILASSGTIEEAEMWLTLETDQGSANYDVTAHDDGAGGKYYRFEGVLPGKGVLLAATGSESDPIIFHITEEAVTIPPGGHVVQDIVLDGTCNLTGSVTNRPDFDIIGIAVLKGESSMASYD